jgi:tripartite-type tricarboxylate transporter receptor subunit TctC
MRQHKMTTLFKLFTAAVLTCCASLSVAQTAASFPNRTIKILVPFAPGGSSDVLARLVAQRMTADWGQTVIVENKPGAGATLGADQVAKAPPDGYTLLLAATHHIIAQNVFKNLPYDIGRDLAPVSVIAMIPNMVVVNAKIPANTIQEFVALAKAQPGKLNYGSAGAGTAHHLIGEMFNLQAQTDIVHVPYKGSAPAISDLVSGQTQLMFDTITAGLPQVTGGKTRALAVTTAKRSSALPDVPTLNETILPGFDVGTWFGLMAPAKTPSDIVNKLSAEVTKIVNIPELKSQLLATGAEPIGNTAAEMSAQVKKELDSFAALLKQIKLTVE